MFKVDYKQYENYTIYGVTVYAVRTTELTHTILFLIHRDEEWQWISAADCTPRK